MAMMGIIIKAIIKRKKTTIKYASVSALAYAGAFYFAKFTTAIMRKGRQLGAYKEVKAMIGSRNDRNS